MFGDGLEEQGPCLGVIVGRFHQEGEQDRFDEVGGGKAQAAQVDRGEAIRVEGGDKGPQRDGLARADGTRDKEDILTFDPSESMAIAFWSEGERNASALSKSLSKGMRMKP